MRSAFFTFLFTSLLAAPVGAAARLPLELPVRDAHDPSRARIPAPVYAGDVLEIRLAPAAAARAFASGRGGARRALGIPALDRALADLQAFVEPEFRGEHPAAPGSGEPDLTAFYVAHLPPGVSLEAALRRLGDLPEVASAEPIAILPLSVVPNDSLWSSSYWFYQASRRDLHAPEAWDVCRGDSSIVVAILDTGVLPYHPDLGGTTAGLAGQLWTNWPEQGGVPGVDDDGNGFLDDARGWDFVNVSGSIARPWEDYADEDNDPNDVAAHGTGVAGLVGALTNNVIGVSGTMWDVRLMPLRVAWAYESASLGSGEVRMDFVAQAIRYATRMGADIINCSFANLDQSGVAVALDIAASQGVTVVTSAGNNGEPNYMATRLDVISVASVGPTDVVSPFSNRGGHVDLAAPGQGIASTWLAPWPVTGDSIEFRQPSYRSTLNGTSFAAPLVSGAAGLLQARRAQLAEDPLTPESVLLRLIETSDDISAENPTLVGQYGAGRLNLERALTQSWGSRSIRLGERATGPAAVFTTESGERRVAFITFNHLVILDGATLDTVAVTPLPRIPTYGVTAGPLREGGGGLGLFVSLQGGIAAFNGTGVPLPNWPVTVPTIEGQLRGCAVGDLDFDGVPEVVSGSEAGRVWAWHVDGTRVANFPVQVAPVAIHPVALALLGADDRVRIIAAAEDGTVSAIENDGSTVSGWPVTLPGNPTCPVEMLLAGVSTVFIGVDQDLYALGPNGAILAPYPVRISGSLVAGEEVALGDIDLDTHPEIVLVTSAGGLEARDSTGALEPGFPVSLPAFSVGSPVMGQIVGEWEPELMIYAGNPLTIGVSLVAYQHDGTAVPGWPKPGRAGPRPTLADLEDDTTKEVIAGSGPIAPRLFVYDNPPHGATGVAPLDPWPTFRGNMARTGSRTYATTGTADVTAPGAISDLSATIRHSHLVVLSWTAPGEDGAFGQASRYDVRTAPIPITAENFAAATRIFTVPTPGPPGSTDTLQVAYASVDGAGPTGTHYFAIRALDADGNAGPISNVASVTFPDTPPGPQAIALAPMRNPSRVPAGLRWQADAQDIGRPHELRIHDLSGRLVRRIPLGDATAGIEVHSWNGTDDGGRALPAGMYLVRLASPTRHTQTRLVLLP